MKTFIAVALILASYNDLMNGFFEEEKAREPTDEEVMEYLGTLSAASTLSDEVGQALVDEFWNNWGERYADRYDVWGIGQAAEAAKLTEVERFVLYESMTNGNRAFLYRVRSYASIKLEDVAVTRVIMENGATLAELNTQFLAARGRGKTVESDEYADEAELERILGQFNA